MNRSLEQGKAVLSQTREGTSIEAELRNMDDSQVNSPPSNSTERVATLEPLNKGYL
jgi:hypothetical protein